MTLVFTHFKAHVLEAARAPGYAVITLLFPAMLYLFFGVPNGDDRMEANFFMASYCAFAVLGIAFFQFGVGLAQDRESPWEVFLRTLPVSATERFAGRILTALLFGFAAMVVVAVVISVWLPEAIFARVLFAWNALGATFGPLVLFTVFRWRYAPAAAPVAMVVGFVGTVVFYVLPDTPGDFAERFLPFVLAFALLLASRFRSKA